jgi:molybdate transport system ATP-binding protein
VLDINVKRQQGNFRLDVTFQMVTAGVTALFGRSGAGKTSVINMVAGLIRPDAGHIVVNGHCLFDSQKKIHVAPEKRRIGYVFQDGRLFPHLSVRSNLTYGMGLTPAAQRFVSLDQVVSLLGIAPLLDRRPARLSGGEKQRVAIGRALLTSPSMLLMDEPLASLDGARKTEVLPFIGGLSREFSIPIVYVSHCLEEILNLADTMVLLDNGKAVAQGSIEALMSRPDLQGQIGFYDQGTVIATEVVGNDTPGGMTHLRFSGGQLKVPRFGAPVGARVRVRIDSRNVAIALSPPKEISIQNIFPATVEKLSMRNGSLVDVYLDIGAPLLALITPRAGSQLNIRPGQKVFALVKSVAVCRGETGTDDCL